MMFRIKVSMAVLATSGTLWAAPANAQSFCDLVPASAVKTTLGLTGNLVAKPNLEGGNGCDYRGEPDRPNVVVADSSDYLGLIKTVADARFASPLGGYEERVSGVGEAAIYGARRVDYPKYGVYFQQDMIFRAKGKYVNFTVTTAGASGVPKAVILSLAAFVIAKPINTLKDPPAR